MKMKLKIHSVIIAVALAIASWYGASAVVSLYKLVAGTGAVAYQDEIHILLATQLGNNRYKVSLQPQSAAIAGTTYTAILYFDGAPVGTLTTSWTAPEIASQSPHTLTFTGLSFTGVSDITVEVTR